MRSKIALLGLVLTVGLSVAACDIQAGEGGLSFDVASGKAQDTWTRTYTIPDKGRLELINVNGRITAEPATDGKVTVEATRIAKGSTDEAAKELLAKLEIKEEVSDTRVRVESRPPRLGGFSGHEMQWKVLVPKGVTVDLRTTNGGVRITGLSGEIHAKTTNGGVTGKGLIPTLIEASAVNGGIDIELASPLEADDSVEIETTNGGVTLAMPSESKATIVANAVNGGVRVSDLDVDKKTQSDSKRRLEGTLNGGGAKVNISTVNGGVRIVRSGSGTS